MAIIEVGLDTLVDVARQTGPDGKPAKIAQVLEQKNDIFLDAPMYPSNQSMSSLTTLAASEPSGEWIGLNEGGSVEKPTTEQIVDGCGMLESWSEVECKVAELSGDVARYLENKDKAFIGGLGKSVTNALMYNSIFTGNTKAFHGIMPRYNSTTTGRGKDQIIKVMPDGTSVTDNMSIVLVKWGEDSVYMQYPKDLPSGLQYDFKGKVTKELANNKLMDVYRGKYDMYTGLVVVDYRCIVRACNISLAAVLSSDPPNIIKTMSDMLDYLPDADGACFYMEKTLISHLRWAMLNRHNTPVTVDDWMRDGRKLRSGRLSFMGHPIGRVDQMSKAEALVV